MTAIENSTAAQAIAHKLYLCAMQTPRNDGEARDHRDLVQDGAVSYDQWIEESANAGDHATQSALEAVSREDFAAAWEALLSDADDLAEAMDVVRGFGDFASAGTLEDIERAAQEWVDHDFTPNGIKSWLEAGAFTAHAANALYEAGVTSEEAGERREELRDRGNQIGYAVANGDLSVAKALKILGR